MMLEMSASSGFTQTYRDTSPLQGASASTELVPGLFQTSPPLALHADAGDVFIPSASLKSASFKRPSLSFGAGRIRKFVANQVEKQADKIDEKKRQLPKGDDMGRLGYTATSKATREVAKKIREGGDTKS